jgi:hypothetical protein
MKRNLVHQSQVVLAVTALVFTVGLGAELAWAQNAHFIDSKTTLTVEQDGDLVVRFKEAGLGDAETTYLFSADATITCTCVTNSGRCPSAANKQTFAEEVSGTFSPKNGTVSATLTITAPECPSGAPPTCGGGQRFELSAISYTDISLTDTTNNVTAGGIPSDQGPLTFFTCP